MLLSLILALFFNLSAWAQSDLGPQAQLGANTAVVIIDMQEGFYRMYGVARHPKLQSLITKQIELLRWAKQKRFPVIVVEYANQGRTDQRLITALRGHPHRVITKTTDDAYSMMNPSIFMHIETLNEWGIGKLIVSGTNGSACVHDSIQGATVYGYRIFTSPDIVGDITTDPPIHPDRTWVFQHRLLQVSPNLSRLQGLFR